MGSSSQQVWQLVRGEELLGEIVIEHADFPWLAGVFVPQAAFADVKPRFDAELALVESDLDSNVEAWERIYDRITASMSMVSPRGTPVPEFLLHLHVQGDQAWFRYSDEPFDRD